MKTLLHHLFIPSETNNYRAKAIHLDFLTYYLLVIMMISFLYQSTPLANVLGIATDMPISRLLELTNQQRAENGLSPLVINESLSKAAINKANDMFASNYWAHFGPNGQSPWDFIINSGYKYEFAGENLCKNFMTSDGCIKAWMDSPTHRSNILRGVYTDIGFGVVNGTLNGEETTVVVQMFGTPLNRPIRLVQQTAAKENDVLIQSPTTAPVVKSTRTDKTTATTNAPEKKLLSKDNLLGFNLNLSTMFLIILFITLLLDLYYANKLQLVRLTGKHIIHLIFLAIICLSLFIINKGVIL